MVPHTYAYFIGSLFFLLIWIILFVRRSDLRYEMLIVSIIGMLIGPVLNHFLYRQDWWNPLYITGIKGGLEDLIVSFSNIGIVTVIYEETFNKRYVKKLVINTSNIIGMIRRFSMFVFVALLPILYAFYVLKIHSSTSNFIGLIIGGTFILLQRPDLLKDSLWSALFMALISLPAFFIPEILSPGWVANSWQLNNLTSITLLGAPIEDVIWYLLIGFCCGSVFEYIFDLKIQKQTDLIKKNTSTEKLSRF